MQHNTLKRKQIRAASPGSNPVTPTNKITRICTKYQQMRVFFVLLFFGSFRKSRKNAAFCAGMQHEMQHGKEHICMRFCAPVHYFASSPLVAGPHTPSICRHSRYWKIRSALRVSGPKTPSMSPA